MTNNPKWYRVGEKKLAVLQRRTDRRKPGSSNKRKAIKLLASRHERIANQRKDFLNKEIAKLIDNFGFIAIEDLGVENLARNNHLSKSILDAGWGYFKQRLLDKAANAGRVVTLVNPAYTSQTCSKCGERQKLTLNDRWYSCPCGNSLDRDVNAAINVLAAGRAVWALSSSIEGLAQESVG